MNCENMTNRLNDSEMELMALEMISTDWRVPMGDIDDFIFGDIYSNIVESER